MVARVAAACRHASRSGSAIWRHADTVATKVQALVDAVNAALTSVRTNTNADKGSTAALKGDSELRTLTSQLLQTMSDAVSGAGSPGLVGIDLTREGTVKFTEATFLATLASDPGTVQRMFAGAPAVDAQPATATTPAVAAQDTVDGLSQRLEALTKRTTNATTGTLTLLAQGRETLVNDFKSRIADWDLRLAARKETLTRQFTAMETALSSLRNQSTWLAGQINSLPSSS